MIWLIDSSVWIPLLRGELPAADGTDIKDMIKRNAAAICPIIKFEILSGMKTEREYKEIEEGFSLLHNIQIGEDIWEAAYLLSWKLRRRGFNLPPGDIIVASAAIASGALLVHRDKHFDIIAKHSRLKTMKI